MSVIFFKSQTPHRTDFLVIFIRSWIVDQACRVTGVCSKIYIAVPVCQGYWLRKHIPPKEQQNIQHLYQVLASWHLE